MRAIILVGGLGTRLRPLTDNLPKPLVPIAGEPLMTRTLRRLQAQGVREVVLAVQYLAAAFHEHYGAGAALGLRLRIVEEPQPLGTAGAVRYAATLHGALSDGPTLVLNGDELTALDVAALWRHHHQSGGLATIAVREVADPTAFGVVVSDAAGRVTAFQEKPAAGTALANTINSGAYVFERAAIEQIPPAAFAMLERDLFPRLLAAGATIAAYPHSAYSQDIGTLAGYLAANAAVLQGMLPGERPLGRELAPGIWAATDVQLDPTATLTAPVMLGAGTCVGPRAVIERAVIWERVTIESDARVRDAVLATGSRVPRAAQVVAEAVGPPQSPNH